MSVRYEGAGAENTDVEVFKAGEELGENVIPEGQIALVFSYDEVFFIQGKPEEITTLLQVAQAAVEGVNI